MKSAREIKRSYHQQLQTLQWMRFSQEMIQDAGGVCWACGREEGLQVHHLVYRDVMAWEYEPHEVRVLCKECHTSVHVVADLIWVELLRFESHELEIILKRLKRADPSHREDTGLSIRGLRGADMHGHRE